MKTQNTQKLKKMPSFFMLLGTGQAWETDVQVWNLHFALIMDLQITVTATQSHRAEQQKQLKLNAEK